MKTAENKSREAKAYASPLICLPIKNQLLNLAEKRCADLLTMTLRGGNRFAHRHGLVDVHDEQVNEFRNVVMLESVFGWILSSSLNADGAKN